MQSFKKVFLCVITLLIVSNLYTVSVNADEAVGKQGIVKGDAVNFRKEPNTSAGIFAVLAEGTWVTVLESSGDWYKINYKGSSGWMYGDYVILVDKPDTIKSAASSRGGTGSRSISEQNAATGEQIAEYSKKFLGVPYKYGGATPEGFDCSGLTYYIYKQFGIALERTASGQSTQGVLVDKSELKPGDLIFFDTDGDNDGQVTHNGMYIGDNKFIHSANSRTVVRITALTDSYYTKTYVKAKRILN